MWQNFTEPARKAVFYAQKEAEELGENCISTDHFLLGLVKDSDNAAVWVLGRFGVSPGSIRAEIAQHGGTPARLGQEMQLTPRSKRVVDLAQDEAKQFNVSYIGTEHLLLGIIREAGGRRGRVLTKLGVELDRARKEVAELPADLVEKPSDPENPLPSDPEKIITITPTTNNMAANKWQYLTIRGRKVIASAQDEAQKLGSSTVSGEHILLGLTNESDSVAALILDRMNVSIDHIRQEVERNVVAGNHTSNGTQKLSGRAQRILDFALEEAKHLNDNFIGTEHLLLGLIRDGEGLPGRILAEIGFEIDDVREAVVSLNDGNN